MMGYVVVFVGAGVGGAIRHAMNIWVARFMGTHFPWHTFAINITASEAESFRDEPRRRVLLTHLCPDLLSLIDRSVDETSLRIVGSRDVDFAAVTRLILVDCRSATCHSLSKPNTPPTKLSEPHFPSHQLSSPVQLLGEIYNNAVRTPSPPAPIAHRRVAQASWAWRVSSRTMPARTSRTAGSFARSRSCP